jgi:hypothetical protein
MSEHDPPEGGLGGAAEAADDPLTATAMRTLAPLLRDPALWTDPPPSLADSIVAAIAAERAEQDVTAADSPAAVPAAAPVDELSRARGRRLERRRPTMWAALASAAAVLAIAVGIVATRGDGGGGEELAMVPTDLIPGAAGTATVTEFDAGVAIELDVEGLPPAPDGQYYAGWVRSEDGELVGVGSFHMRGRDATVTLWSGVALEDYPILSVTIQTEGEGEGSSGQVVLRGTLVD